MSDLSRRQLLRVLARAAVAASAIDKVAAEQVHRMIEGQAALTGAPYAPTALTRHEYLSLDRLTDLIIPAEGPTPGARAAGAAAWIDMLAGQNQQLLQIYRDGIAWLDASSKDAGGFVAVSEERQRAVLAAVAIKRIQRPESVEGTRFFELARRMTVDAFYTSRLGFARLGYQGNDALAEFTVPAAVIAYMNARSPI